MKKQDKIVIAVCLFMIIVIAVLTILSMIHNSIEKQAFNDEINQIRNQREYMESTKVLVNETGIPEEYTCEQINVMITSDVYPRLERTYNCKMNEEAPMQDCGGYIDPNTKDSFVRYYITKCMVTK